MLVTILPSPAEAASGEEKRRARKKQEFCKTPNKTLPQKLAMPRNKIPKLREPRGPIVQQVRDLFLETEYKASPEDFYEQDIELIKSMDFLLQRYVIMQRKNVEGSVKMVSQMLKWRK